MINIENFNPDLLKIGKKSYKNIGIYYIGYITMKNSDYVKINSVNPLYLIVDEADGYIKEKNGNKYLTFASTDKSKELLKQYTKLLNEIKRLIEKIDDKPGEYEKDYMKIKFNSDDHLPLNKTLKLHKYYPQVFANVCMNYKCWNMIE